MARRMQWAQAAGVVAALACVIGGLVLGNSVLGLLVGLGLLWAAVGDDLMASSNRQVQRATLVIGGGVTLIVLGFMLALIVTGVVESPHQWLQKHGPF
jgi:hypothetical protein